MLKKLGGFLLELVQVVVFSISIFLFIYLLVMQPHKIKGASMEPNFHDGEYLLTDKISYRIGEPERGDVIVFKAPPDFQEEFIKRIIAVPGDTVTLQNGSVYVNSKLLDEKYLPVDLKSEPGSFLQEGQTITVEPESYVVMGDNRNHSFDSRNFGVIKREKITGRAWLVYWPPQQAGTVKAPEYTL